MQSSIKIAIIIDTNVFTPSKNKTRNLSKLPLEEYYRILKTLEFNDLNYEVNIFFPEVVILELISHHTKKISKELEQLRKINHEFADFDNIQIEGFNDFNIESYREELKSAYFNELKIIQTPPNKGKLFEEILEMSLDKKAPFIEGKSDKGFKDSVIFLSLLKFAETNHYDKYLLFTDDKGFIENKKELLAQFQNHVKPFRKIDNCNELEIVKDKNIIKYIDDEFELFKDLKDYISKEFFEILYKKYENAVNIEINLKNYEIEEYELIEDDTTIHQFGVNEFEVEFHIRIDILCNKYYMHSFDWHSRNTNQETIDQYEYYIFLKENDEWCYELNSQSYEINF